MPGRLIEAFFHVHAVPIKGSRQVLCYGVEPNRGAADRLAARVKGQDVGHGRFRRAQVVTLVSEGEPCRN